jgi:4-oxalocrotonate tautomerase
LRHATGPYRRPEASAAAGIIRAISEATGESKDNIFFVIREGRGINFVEHGEHLPEFVEGAAGDKDLIARLK